MLLHVQFLEIYMKDDAELFIQKQWYDIDNQSNMDW